MSFFYLLRIKSVTPKIPEINPLRVSHKVLSVGDPVKKRETSELKESEARTP